MKIVPYTDDHVEAVKAFNARLREGGVRFQFPTSPVPTWLPPAPGRTVYQELSVATDDSRAVRGGYILKHQQFAVGDMERSVGNYQLPLSEGTVDTTYNRLGLRLLQHASGRQPQLYCLGMGGVQRPLPQLLQAMRWRVTPVPFYFRLCRPFRVLRKMSYIRSTALRRLLCNVAAFTGVGDVAGRMIQAVRTSGPTVATSTEEMGRFDGWADELWRKCRDDYSFAAVRSAEVLSILYPPDDNRFITLSVSARESGEVLGWAVLLDTAMSGHRQFGDLRVGTIVDCLSPISHAHAVISAARDCLSARGVDLIITNQSHLAWCDACRRAGFLSGPSNFALAMSPSLTAAIAGVDCAFGRLHLTRGDGDGPIHL